MNINPPRIDRELDTEGGTKGYISEGGIRTICIDGQEVSVARMILSTFVGVCENGIVNWKNGNRLDNRASNLRWEHRYIKEAIKWGESRSWEQNDPKYSRLAYLKSVRDFESMMSTGPEEDAPDDISVFGKPVYLKDFDLLGLKEYMMSGLSAVEQNEVFKK